MKNNNFWISYKINLKLTIKYLYNLTIHQSSMKKKKKNPSLELLLLMSCPIMGLNSSDALMPIQNFCWVGNN